MKARPTALRPLLAILLVIGASVLLSSKVFGALNFSDQPGDSPGIGGGGGGGGPTPPPPGRYGATVYQGLAAVTTGNTGASLLEIGNNGQDIASTGSLYIRPLGMAAASSISFDKPVGENPRLVVPGGLCFGSSPCVDTWPAGGGASFWEIASSHYIQPKTGSAYTTLAFTQTAGGSSALEVNAQSDDTAFAATSVPGTGVAAEFTQGAQIDTDVFVDARPATGDEIMVHVPATGKDYKVWHSGNDGHGSGLDASKLDGFDLMFRQVPVSQQSYSYCGGTSTKRPGETDLNCFCGDFLGVVGGVYDDGSRCIRLQP